MIDRKKLAEILRLHQLWLDGKDGGERADLHGADLHGANLRHANLHYADLHGADLHGADLRHANLYGANLRHANLRGADLRHANLYGANLHGADLHGANLHGANLYGANLHGANLCGANLCGANLYETGFIIIGHIGSRNDVTYYHVQNDLVRCGCFNGTLAEFEESIRERHKDGRYLHEYEAALTFIKSVSQISKEQQK